MDVDVELNFVKDKNKRFVAKTSVIFHCHHYNTFLQRSIIEALEDPDLSSKILTYPAAEEVYQTLSEVFHDSAFSPDEVFQYATKLYKELGFGIIDFTQINNDGGTVLSPTSHYAIGWLEKFGEQEHGVCYFAAGYIQGTVAKAFNKTIDDYTVKEITCLTQKKSCTFQVEVNQ